MSGSTDTDIRKTPRDQTAVFKYLEGIFLSFRKCFSNYRTYSWFVVLVVGFMFRDDTLGVTSVIRTLLLDPGCYEPMLHFFYSKAWSLDSLSLHYSPNESVAA